MKTSILIKYGLNPLIALWTIKRGLPADPNEYHVLNRFIVGKRPVDEALRVAASSNEFAE
ncbi:hypothetical protein V1477_014849 [Vespula maculifrons]|uniref:Uncharacterized protein n=1 Tax=Vespula maculifrons TaxID=7453 RepID=A0ABD2BIN8_VESMC